jgi:hypothetical protein
VVRRIITDTFPPHITVIGYGNVGKNGIPFDGFHGIGV